MELTDVVEVKPPPTVWRLTGDKAGDNAQLQALEARLGIAAVAKSLRYRASRLPNPLKGASLATLRTSASDPLAAPWPVMVIASGRRSVPIARWIKNQTGGRARLVQIGRPRAASNIFDLVITTPQYRVAPAANVIELPVPFTPLVQPRLAEEAARLNAEWQALPLPRIAVLVGGESSTSHIGRALGEKLGRDASRLAAGLGGSLMILSGRRTLPETLSALASTLSVPHRINQPANGESHNPYPGVLGLADAVIVTIDSASMLADGLITGKLETATATLEINFMSNLWNSLFLSTTSVAVGLALGVPAAYAFAKLKFRGSEDIAFTLLSFRFAPPLLVLLPLTIYFQKLGLANTYGGLIWVYQLIVLPLILWIVRGYFEDIPADIEYAYRIAGHDFWSTFRRIALPLAGPGIAAAGLLAFIFAWNNFIFALVLASADKQPVTVGALAFITASGIQFGQIAAGIVLSITPTLVLALYAQRYLVEGLSLGAVKG